MIAPDSREAPTLSEIDFRLLADLLRSHCGLHFTPDLRYLLEKRVSRRVAALGLGSFAAYHHHLVREAGGDEELQRLVDELTTNETYFMRERNQLRALVGEIVPELLRLRRASRPIHIWSAGCSSGEEPYSIVILALEAGLAPERDLRVTASDISRTMLEKARRGEYRAVSFRETEDWLRDRYFQEKDGVHCVSDGVKRHVRFAHLNLLDDRRTGLLGPMDVVLCRNVIIYFDLATRRRVIQAFHDKLRPGGYLLLGHSESLINLSNAFELCHLVSDMVYRKPGPGESGDPWHAAAAAALDEAPHLEEPA